ncbi:hypothetical protein MNBD_BACTEROID05-832, partial [hydrothermal vent metagenome]
VPPELPQVVSSFLTRVVIHEPSIGANAIITQALEQIVTDDPKVSTRIERIYDMDRDGNLQEDEILEFFSDVVDSVKKKGRFLVSSDLLKSFDTNSDGKISRYESLAIKKLLK